MVWRTTFVLFSELCRHTHARKIESEVQILDISIGRKLYSTENRVGVIQYDEGMYGKPLGYYSTLKRKESTQNVPDIRA